MCVMHAPINRSAPKVRKSVKRDQKVATPFNEALLKPDPEFIDERRTATKVEDKGFFAKLFN